MSQQEQIAAALDHIARGDYPNHCRFDDAMKALAADYKALQARNETQAATIATYMESLNELERQRNNLLANQRQLDRALVEYDTEQKRLAAVISEHETHISSLIKQLAATESKRDDDLAEKLARETDVRELLQAVGRVQDNNRDGCYVNVLDDGFLNETLAKVRVWLPEVK